jgi:hypothetical protein
MLDIIFEAYLSVERALEHAYLAEASHLIANASGYRCKGIDELALLGSGLDFSQWLTDKSKGAVVSSNMLDESRAAPRGAEV